MFCLLSQSHICMETSFSYCSGKDGCWVFQVFDKRALTIELIGSTYLVTSAEELCCPNTLRKQHSMSWAANFIQVQVTYPDTHSNDVPHADGIVYNINPLISWWGLPCLAYLAPPRKSLVSEKNLWNGQLERGFPSHSCSDTQSACFYPLFNVYMMIFLCQYWSFFFLRSCLLWERLWRILWEGCTLVSY